MIHLSKPHDGYRYAAEQLEKGSLLWWKVPIDDVDGMHVVEFDVVPKRIKRQIYKARYRTRKGSDIF